MNGDPGQRAAELVAKWENLRGLRGIWESHWTEIANLVYPMHRDYFQNLKTQGGMFNQGEKRNQDIFDSTAVLA